MATVHASLNGQGYTKNALVMADELFAESIYARESQTDIYYGKIVALNSIVEQFSTDPNGMANALYEGYTELFGRHFENVTVSAVPEEPEGKDTFNIILKIRYDREDKTYDFARIIENYNGTLKKVLEIVENGG